MLHKKRLQKPAAPPNPTQGTMRKPGYFFVPMMPLTQIERKGNIRLDTA